MVIWFLDALKKSSKKKETRIKKKIVKVLLVTTERDRDDEILGKNFTELNFIFCYYLLHYASCGLFEK